MHYKFLSLLLISFTIPIQSKISIPKLPEKLSHLLSKSKEESSHHEFNNVEKLDITAQHATIHLETWNQPCVMIELRKKGSPQYIDSITLTHKTQDHTTSVIIHDDHKTSKGRCSVHILTPNNIPFKINTQKGSIYVNDHNACLELQTEYGDISIHQGTNTIIAHTDHGTILVNRKKLQPNHALNLSTDKGDIVLQVPQDFGADMQAHAQHGKISSKLFISLHAQTTQLNDEFFTNMKHHVYGWIGQSQEEKDCATVLLCTQQGSISINPYSNKKQLK